jgi:P27 family predicted phage terminase small subunit
MARKPIPSALHEARGDYRKDPQRRNRREPNIGGEPVKPRHLTGIAATEWKRVVGILSKMGVLTSGEAPALEQYCRAYADWREACKLVDKYGLMVQEDRGEYSVWKRNPADLAKQALALLLIKYLSEFGLTPSSRTKVQSAEKGGSDILLDMLKARSN